VFLNYPCILSPSVSPDNREYALVPTILFESPKGYSDGKFLGPTNPLIRPWMWSGLSRHIIVSNGSILWIWQWTFRFHKRPTERLSASEVFSSMQSLYHFHDYLISFMFLLTGISQKYRTSVGHTVKEESRITQLFKSVGTVAIYLGTE
jgi:hypothetical protein